MKGFGQPKYWLQVVYTNETPDKWVPLTSGSHTKARDLAALSLRNPNVDYTLILNGRVKKGAVVEQCDILDEFQSYDVPGARQYQLGGKVKA